MKIEMGESLGVSWMKHEKGCDFVQTNWKVSPSNEWKHLDEIQRILDELKERFGEASYDIFGNDGAAQIVRQSECDVLGIANLPNGGIRINALEVAIHLRGDGLHYSGYKQANPTTRTNVSDDKVVAKLFGIAMTLYASMDNRDGEIAFASPIATDAILNSINERLALLTAVLEEHGFGFTFRMYANRDFYTMILRRVMSVVDSVADTNELFLRAMQIYLASSNRYSQELIADEDPAQSNIEARPSLTVPAVELANDLRSIRRRHNRFDVFVNDSVISVDNSMGMAAREVVKAYVENTPGITFSQLREAFPRIAHGYRDVVAIEANDLDISRFSLPIRLADGTSVLVTNQWYGAGEHENWQHFCRHVANLSRANLTIRIEPHNLIGE